jgi:hypothetical protein
MKLTSLEKGAKTNAEKKNLLDWWLGELAKNPDVLYG